MQPKSDNMWLSDPSLVTDAAANPLALGAGTIIALGIISIGGSLLAYWLASLLLCERNRATFGRAIVVHLALLGFGVVTIIAGALIFQGITMASKAGHDLGENAPMILVVAGVVAWIVGYVAVVARTYAISGWRAIGLIILSVIFGIVIQFTGQFIVLGAAFLEQMPQMQKKLAETKWPELPKATKFFSRDEIAQRQAALQQRFNQLEIMRRYMPPNDPEAMQRYMKMKAAYDADLVVFQQDAVNVLDE